MAETDFFEEDFDSEAAEAAEVAMQEQVKASLHRNRLGAFTLQPQHKIRNKHMGNPDVRYMYSVKDFTTKALYPTQQDNPFAGFFPELVRVFRAEDDQRIVYTNFVSSQFPGMKDDWRKYLKDAKFKLPNDGQDLDRLFATLQGALERELKGYDMVDTQENFDRLLHLRMAIGKGFVTGMSPKPILTKLPEVLVEWLKSDVEMPMLLFSFHHKFASKYAMGDPRPIMPLDEAKEAIGIPFNRLRTLYGGS